MIRCDNVYIYIGALLVRCTCSPRVAYCKSNCLLILLDWVETEICFLKESGIFKRKKNLDRHDLGLIFKYSQLRDPPHLNTHNTTGTFRHFRILSSSAHASLNRLLLLYPSCKHAQN
jgi:hypothetical protein